MVKYNLVYKLVGQNEYIYDSFTVEQFEKFMKRVTKGANVINICGFSITNTQGAIL